MIEANMMNFHGKLTITRFDAAEIFYIDFFRADHKTFKAVSGRYNREITLDAEKCTKLKDW
jgi:hypothetical protein